MQTGIQVAVFESPIGSLRVSASEAGIIEVQFMENCPSQDSSLEIILACRKQLKEYFAGARTTFDLPLAPKGTVFEQRVWTELQSVEFGATASYLDIAKKLNNTGAIRAVGRANGANPIAIIVPCHRVIGSDGTLTGYAGGLWRKRWLLDHEAKTAGTQLF